MIAADQPGNPVRRELTLYAVGLVGVLVIAQLASAEARLPLIVLGIGSLAGFWVVSRLRRASPTGLRRAIPLVSLADAPREPSRPSSLTRCESLITEGTNRDKAADLRLRPHLHQLCRSGLSDVGVDLDRDRRRAADRLGPGVIETLDGSGVVSTDELHAIFTALEDLQSLSTQTFSETDANADDRI